MAPEPAAPAAPDGGGGDYGGWTWAQIQAAINAGVPQSLHDAATDFDETKEKLDTFVKDSTNETDRLTGPEGTWQGPASGAFHDLMTELITNVGEHAVALTPYKGALDKAGDDLTDAQADVKNAVGEAAQQTIDQYNNDAKAYNDALPAYQAGTGPQPVNPGPAPYATDGGQTTVDVSRYPAIEAALNERMRTIITTLAGNYKGATAAATAPPDKELPNPTEQPPPDLKGDLPPADLLPQNDLKNAPDGADAPDVPPPADIPPVADGGGNLGLVTKPGGLADLPQGAAPPALDPIAAPPAPALIAGPDAPLLGDGFNGVLGTDLGQPGDLPKADLVTGPGPGAIGVPTEAPNTPAGAAPLGFSTLNTGLAAPGGRGPVTGPGTGVLGTPTGIRSDLVVPGGHISTTASSSVLGRGAETGPLSGGVPPMLGGAYGGMVSAGPDLPGGFMYDEDVFGETEEERARRREQSLVAGPGGETAFAHAADERERERERKNRNDAEEDMWGSTTDASSALQH